MADRSPGDQRGFTLVELMIALVIFSVAVAGILSVAVSLTNGFREQRLAIQAQDAVRSPLDLIADSLRQVSAGVQTPYDVYDTVACSRGALAVTNSSTGPDTLDVIYASGGVVTTITDAGSTVVDSSAHTIDVWDGSNFAIGDLAMITDFSTGHVVQVTAVTATTISYAGNSCSYSGTYGYSPRPLLIRMQHARFSVYNDTSNNNMPTLWMNVNGLGDEPLAEGIEDMQVAVGVDLDATLGLEEGTASATDDWLGNFAGDATFDLATHSNPRAVRVTLVARTTGKQAGAAFIYTRPAIEDRAAGAADQYRRRVLKTIVDLRNVAGSK